MDERDDAAVEHLLDSASMNVSAMLASVAEADAPSSVTAAEGDATNKTLPQDEAGDEEDEDEDEELARFMQMTLDGMARVQEGLRGVFAQTCRRLVVKRAAAAAAQRVGGVGGGAAVASADRRVPAGDHGLVSASH